MATRVGLALILLLVATRLGRKGPGLRIPERVRQRGVSGMGTPRRSARLQHRSRRRLGATVGGYYTRVSGRGRIAGAWTRRADNGCAYGVPVFYGGFGYGYGYEQPPAPVTTVVQSPR